MTVDENPELELEQKKATLALLHVARQDFTRTLKICETALAMPDRMDKRDVMSWVFQAAAVVTYGRPFTRSKVIGRLEDEWTTFLGDAHLQDTHKKIMDQRNEAVAHADPKWRLLFLAPAGTQTPDGIILTEPKIVSLSAEPRARLLRGDTTPLPASPPKAERSL